MLRGVHTLKANCEYSRSPFEEPQTVSTMMLTRNRIFRCRFICRVCREQYALIACRMRSLSVLRYPVTRQRLCVLKIVCAFCPITMFSLRLKDEKAMGVLKHVTRKWRLFWVLESIGLSFLLAVLAVKVTGNGTWVDKKEDIHGDGGLVRGCDSSDCSVYEWYFIVYFHPIAVTVCALLATNAVSNPRSSLPARVLFPTSSGWFVWLILVSVWFAEAFDEFVEERVFYWYLNQIENWSGVPTILFVFCYRQQLQTQLVNGIQTYRSERDDRSVKYLIRFGVPLHLFDLVGDLLQLFSFFPYDESPFRSIVLYFDLILWIAIESWLIWGILAAGTHPAGGTSIPSPPKKWMLFAWGFREGGYRLSYLARDFVVGSLRDLAGGKLWADAILYVVYKVVCSPLGWALLVGTFLMGEKPGTYGVAFWAATIFVGETVTSCALTWIHAWIDGTVK